MRQLIVPLCLMFGFGGISRAEDADLKELVELLEAFESRFDGYRWKSEQRELLVPPDANLLIVSAAETMSWSALEPYRIDGDFSYDVRQGRFRILVSQTLRWHDGAAPFASTRQAWSYNGVMHRHWNKSQHGAELPELDGEPTATRSNLNAEISSTVQEGQTLATSIQAAGLNSVPPFVDLTDGSYKLVRLSEILKERTAGGEKLILQRDGTNKWTVTMVHSTRDRIGIQLDIDGDLGCGVTEVRLRDAEHAHVESRKTFHWSKSDGGIWIPDCFTFIHLPSRYAFRTKLEGIAVNPEFADDEFVLEMPKGAMVDDSVEKAFYTVGGGLVDDAKKVRAFLERHELVIPPQQPLEEPESAGWQSWLLRANVGLAVVALLLFAWRRYRRQAAGMILVTGLLNAMSDTATADIVWQEYQWVVSHSRSL